MNAVAKLQVTPEASGFGACITGVDLHQPLTPEVRQALQSAAAEHGVLCFPAQPLSIAELEALSLQFGPFGHDPYVAPMPGHPHILAVQREASEKASVFGGAWHSDWSFQATPPSYTLLHAQEVPPVGGDTLFVDAIRAYEALSPTMQSLLKDLKALHSAGPAYGPKGLLADRSVSRAMTILIDEKAEACELHPLVRTHPVSGRRGLFINPVYTVGIANLTVDESKALLDFLFQHLLSGRYGYRQQWAPEMLLLWDNRCTMHCATGGYDGHRRVMHRATVAGERPV